MVVERIFRNAGWFGNGEDEVGFLRVHESGWRGWCKCKEGTEQGREKERVVNASSCKALIIYERPFDLR